MHIVNKWYQQTIDIRFDSWHQRSDWLAKWLIMLGFGDLRQQRVYQHSTSVLFLPSKVWDQGHRTWWVFSMWFWPNTVETPYNTAPYITDSNIARLGHGSQNLWSKLWIPIVKSAPVRVIFMWKSVPKKSIHGSSDIYLGTRWKQWHDSPWSYRSDVIVTFLCYGTIGIIWRRDHQSTAKEV